MHKYETRTPVIIQFLLPLSVSVRETDRQTVRQTDRETERQRDRERETQTDRKTEDKWISLMIVMV